MAPQDKIKILRAILFFIVLIFLRDSPANVYHITLQKKYEKTSLKLVDVSKTTTRRSWRYVYTFENQMECQYKWSHLLPNDLEKGDSVEFRKIDARTYIPEKLFSLTSSLIEIFCFLAFLLAIYVFIKPTHLLSKFTKK